MAQLFTTYPVGEVGKQDFMWGDTSVLKSTAKNLISVLELRRVLYAIVDNSLDVCFRYRLLGEMWQPNFCRVMKVTEKGVVLNDEVKNHLIFVTDLSQITQFEIDAPLYNFHPHNHYEVDAS